MAALILCGVLSFFEPSQQRQHLDTGVVVWGTIAMSWFMAWFIVPVWGVVLIPLYLFVPPGSTLWRWPVCTACGALAGLLIMASFFRGVPGFGQLSPRAWDVYILAGIIGGITCLIGSLTKHLFKQPSNQSLQPTAGRSDA